MTDDPDRFHWRRIPGTAALAITNLIAGMLVFDLAPFSDVVILAYIARFGGPQVWALFYLFAGVMLTVACATRRWVWLNMGSFVSLFVWTATSLAIATAWLTSPAGLSPVGLALAFWMVGGQAAMLITPLIAPTRGPA